MIKETGSVIPNIWVALRRTKFEFYIFIVPCSSFQVFPNSFIIDRITASNE